MRKILIMLFFFSFLLFNCCFANYNTQLPLSGESLANQKLQYDALKAVYMTVGTKATNCGNMKVINTKVTKNPYDLQYRGHQVVGGFWEELWSVNACSYIYDVSIRFIINETGTIYLISPKNVIPR